MSKRSDLNFLAQAVGAFIPSDRHIGMRLRIQKYVSPAILAKLDKSSLHLLSSYVSADLIQDIQDEIGEFPEFFDWLLNEEDALIMLHKARKSAVQTLVDAMEMDDEGDSRKMAVKVKAAESILKMKDNGPNNKVNQTLKISALPQNMRSLANKSTEDLEQELLALKASN